MTNLPPKRQIKSGHRTLNAKISTLAAFNYNLKISYVNQYIVTFFFNHYHDSQNTFFNHTFIAMAKLKKKGEFSIYYANLS